MKKFAADYKDALFVADQFEGMMSVPSIAIFQAFLSYQNYKKISGEMVEFGVYRGRSAAVLMRNLRQTERITLVDVADYPEFDKLNEISNCYDFFKGKSEDLVVTEDFQIHMDRPIRFSHHDASHSYRNVSEEMMFMQDRLSPQGIMVLDDFGNPSFLQVVAACFAHLQKPENSLHFLLNSNNKAYLCRKEDVAFYEDFIVNYLLKTINSLGLNQYLSRTEKTNAYRGFSIAAKPNADMPDLYGVNTYGMQYYTVKSVK